jgi:hypothetical protein
MGEAVLSCIDWQEMADLARSGVAVGRGLGWKPNAFLLAYEKNRIAVTEPSLDSSPVARFFLTLAGRCLDFDRSPTDLLELMTQDADKKLWTSAAWPKSPEALTNQLRRIAPQLADARRHRLLSRDKKGPARSYRDETLSRVC